MVSNLLGNKQILSSFIESDHLMRHSYLLKISNNFVDDSYDNYEIDYKKVYSELSYLFHRFILSLIDSRTREFLSGFIFEHNMNMAEINIGFDIKDKFITLQFMLPKIDDKYSLILDLKKVNSMYKSNVIDLISSYSKLFTENDLNYNVNINFDCYKYYRFVSTFDRYFGESMDNISELQTFLMVSFGKLDLYYKFARQVYNIEYHLSYD